MDFFIPGFSEEDHKDQAEHVKSRHEGREEQNSEHDEMSRSKGCEQDLIF